MDDLLRNERDVDSIAVIPIGADRLEDWRANAMPEASAWVASTGFSAGPGHHVPGAGAERGKLASVLVRSRRDRRTRGRSAGVPDAVPDRHLSSRPELVFARTGAGGARLGARRVPLRAIPEVDAAVRSAVPRIRRGGRLRASARTGGGARARPHQHAGQRHDAEGPRVRGVRVGGPDTARGDEGGHGPGAARRRLPRDSRGWGARAPTAPRLIDLTWGDPGDPRLTLVGKGVCFDSGGLDIKPASGMRLMKKDMGGAAHAIGLADLVMSAALPVRLRLLVPAVENAIRRQCVPPRRRARDPQGSDRRGRQHRRGGENRAERRVDRWRRGHARSDGRLRHPHRRRAHRARRRPARDVLQRRGRSPRASPRPGATCTTRYGACRCTHPYRALIESKVADIMNGGESAVRRSDHRRAVPAGVRAGRDPLGALRHHGVDDDGEAGAGRWAARRWRCARCSSFWRGATAPWTRRAAGWCGNFTDSRLRARIGEISAPGKRFRGRSPSTPAGGPSRRHPNRHGRRESRSFSPRADEAVVESSRTTLHFGRRSGIDGVAGLDPGVDEALRVRDPAAVRGHRAHDPLVLRAVGLHVEVAEQNRIPRHGRGHAVPGSTPPADRFPRPGGPSRVAFAWIPSRASTCGRPRCGRKVRQVNGVHAQVPAAHLDDGFQRRALQAHRRPEARKLRQQVVAHGEQRHAGEQHVPELPPGGRPPSLARTLSGRDGDRPPARTPSSAPGNRRARRRGWSTPPDRVQKRSTSWSAIRSAPADFPPRCDRGSKRPSRPAAVLDVCS